MAILKEVAKEAQVAVMTASKVFNNNPSVRPYIRERVLKAARKLNYTPNLVAKGLRTSSLDIISLATVALDNPFFGMLAQKISEKINNAGLKAVLCSDLEKVEEVSNALSATGTILVIPGDYSHVERFAHGRENVITVFALEPAKSRIPDIGLDFRPAYEELFFACIRENRRNFLYYCVDSDYDFLKHNKKFQIISSLLKQDIGNITLPPRSATRTPARLSDHILKKGKEVDAIFCENDILAVSLSHELHHRGISIPDEIRIIGCDGILPLASGTWSIKIDIDGIAENTVRLLLGLVRAKRVPENVIMIPKAILGN